ncbi:hypothetical protein [Polaromonas hydrogenivorans]
MMHRSLPAYLLPEGAAPQPSWLSGWRLPLAVLAMMAAATVPLVQLSLKTLREGVPGKSPQAGASNAALTVTSDSARRIQWPVNLQAMGAIEVSQEAAIGSPSAGLRLVEIRAETGNARLR